VTGAALALGVWDGQLPEQTPEQIALTVERLQGLLRDFAAEFGSRRCHELTGHDLGTPEGYRAFRESTAHERCPGYVAWVCDRLAPLLTNVGLPVDPVRS
jgi:hypothetical protein